MHHLLLRVAGLRTPVQFHFCFHAGPTSAEICSLFLGLAKPVHKLLVIFFGNHSITFIAGNQGATLRAIKQTAHIHSFVVVGNLSCCFRIIRNLIPMTSHLCSSFLGSKVGCRTLWPCAWPLPLLSEELEVFVLFLYYFLFHSTFACTTTRFAAATFSFCSTLIWACIFRGIVEHCNRACVWG